MIAFSYSNYLYRDYINYACMVYGLAGSEWPYRSGIVHSESLIPAFASPDGEEITQVSGDFIVFWQTENRAWYRISLDKSFEPMPELWVRSSDVIPVSLPDNIPLLIIQS